jgi:hypothetical protein
MIPTTKSLQDDYQPLINQYEQNLKTLAAELAKIINKGKPE